MRLRFCLIAILVFGCSVLAHAQTGKEVYLVGTNRLPTEIKYQNGYTLVFHRAHVRLPGPADQSVAVLKPNGAEVFARNPGSDIPEAKMAQVRDAAVVGDDQLVVVAQAWRTLTPGPDGASLLLVYELSSGALSRMVRLNPVMCTRVVADPGGNIWCLGTDLSRFKQDYELLYKFSLQGELLGRYLPRSQVDTSDSLPAYHSSPFGRPQLSVSRDGHICAWMPNVDTLVELESNGGIVTRTKVLGKLPSEAGAGGRLVTAGITPDGTLLKFLPLSVGNRPEDASQENPPPGLYRFNRATGAWEILTTEWAVAYPPNRLVGADDGGLAIWVRDQSKIVRLQTSGSN